MGIRVEGISKKRGGRAVLEEVSFEAPDGDFTCLLAPTGEGKTTLLRLMAGLEPPDAGRVFFGKVEVTGVPVQKRNIAMVHQWFVNYPSLSVYENIASPLRAQGCSGPTLDGRVRRAAEKLRLEGLLERRPGELSGGQQQRLAIARAFVKEAEYIFLDEPLTNLDYKLQEELRGELKALFAQRGRGAVIYATPHPMEALSLATSVGFLRQGRLEQFGPAGEVYRHPATLALAKYFSHPAMNVFEAVIGQEAGQPWMELAPGVRLKPGPWAQGRADRRYWVGVRAHALTFSPSAPHQVGIRAKVELREVVGTDTEWHLKYPGGSLVVWRQGLETLAMGETVTVFLDPRTIFVFEAETQRLLAWPQED